MPTTGRIWLLCQYLDKERKGWVRVSDLRAAITKKDASLYICGWRRLRTLLHEGMGVFWVRDNNGRLFLHSTKRVAQNLGVERLSGNPIAIDPQILCRPIQQVKAELYASFHATRENNPISRESLEHVTGLSRRTQQTYDKLSGTQTTTCIAIGKKANKEDVREALWQSGGATFKLTDHKGRFGKEGQIYVARQLPNQYDVKRTVLPKGRQRKINSWLKQPTKTIDLVNTLAQGNDGVRIASLGRRYCQNGKSAVLQQEKQKEPCYWPTLTKVRQTNIWFSVDK